MRAYTTNKDTHQQTEGKQAIGLSEKLSTSASPSISSGEDSDDDTHDVALAIQENYTQSDVCHPQSCPPKVQSATSSDSKSKSKTKIESSDSILKECVVESRRLQDKLETFLPKQDTSHDS